MTPPDPRIEAIFHEALHRPPADRVAFVAEATRGDESLQQEVQRLLVAHQDAGTYFEPPNSPEIEGELARLKPEEAGERIGPYKLMEQIGEGGFGVVWVADQDAPVRRRVALKIIKMGMDTKEVIARFEQERQALAMMDHPHIAKVLDAGATQWGRPFFVMELVRGVRITDYCDQANLPTAERLALFVQVCNAVQHAHQKGVIHRDLKPSNILVTLHDGMPVVKVIDFGVAKATQQQRLTDLTIYTQFQQMIGTPLYMSPEQAEMSGLDIDTRSDIYSLGVLLYELLTGRTPFDPEHLMKQGLDEIRRTIREVEPQTPSMFLKTMADETRVAVARHRQSDPLKLAKLLSGDLDWIVMKALEKDRTRRYETAKDLVDDIERHLADEAVLARPASATYRFRRLVKRNKFAFAAGTAVVVSLLGGIVVSTWQAWRASNAEGNVTRERNLARISAQEANEQKRSAERNLYTAIMNLAPVMWERANIGRLREMLEETRNYPHREFEWYYWQRQVHLELRRLQGHKSAVTSVAFSPNGRRIMTGSMDHTVKVWDMEMSREEFSLKHAGGISSVAFSRDGGRIVTGSWDGTAKLWDAEAGRELRTLHPSEGVWSVAISPDGRRIVTGCGTTRMWDAETGRELFALKRSAELIQAVAFSPDGLRFATGPKIWDVETGGEIFTLQGHHHSVRSIAFSPNGRWIATGSEDMTAKLWDAKTGRELLHLQGHDRGVRSVAFSPDSRRLVTTSSDNLAKVWNLELGREIFVIRGHTDAINSAAFSPDGQKIVTGSADQSAKVWDAGSDREVLVKRPGSYQPEPEWIVGTNREVFTLRAHTQDVKSVAFSPDSLRIVTGSGDRTAKVWDVETGRELVTIKGQLDGLVAVAFSPDGSRLVAATRDTIYFTDGLKNPTGARDDIARIWDVESGRELLALEGHKGYITSVAFSFDGRWVVTSSADKTAKLWDATTGRELLTFRGHDDAVQAVAISPDGRRICTGSEDKTAKLWATDTGDELVSLKGHAGAVWSVAFSPDGQIVTGSEDKIARLWDATTGHEILSLKGHNLGIKSVAVSANGQRIITGSADHSAKVWDAETGRELLSLNQHSETVWSVAFSRDGRRIITGSGDWTAKVWTAATASEVEGWRTVENRGTQRGNSSLTNAP